MAETTLITAQIELDRVFTESEERPVVLFKHSPRCSISANAFGGFQKFVEALPEGEPTLFALVNVVESRTLSDAVATRTGVRHESPQAIVLRDRRVVWSGSHWDITDEMLTQALAEARS